MPDEFVTLEGGPYKFPDPYPKRWVFVGQNGPIVSVGYNGALEFGDGYDPPAAAKEAAQVFWLTFARQVAQHFMRELGSAGGGGGAAGPAVSACGGAGGNSWGTSGSVMGAGGGGRSPMTIYGQGRTVEPWESYQVPDGMKQVSMMIGGKKIRIEIE